MTQNTYKSQPKFHLAVDCVIFGYERDELKLLLYPRRFKPSKGDWSLMGGFVQEEETMEDAARRVLMQTVGLQNIFLEQVGGFSEPNRDPGGRVISMAYYALIRIDQHDSELANLRAGLWWPITQIPDLVFDHTCMVNKALDKLQQQASYKLIGKELLPEQFTLTQLHNLYNAIFQKSFDAGNFRKKLSSLDILEKLALKDTTNSKRGAFYYRFKDNADSYDYDRIVKK